MVAPKRSHGGGGAHSYLVRYALCLVVLLAAPSHGTAQECCKKGRNVEVPIRVIEKIHGRGVRLMDDDQSAVTEQGEDEVWKCGPLSVSSLTPIVSGGWYAVSRRSGRWNIGFSFLFRDLGVINMHDKDGLACAVWAGLEKWSDQDLVQIAMLAARLKCYREEIEGHIALEGIESKLAGGVERELRVDEDRCRLLEVPGFRDQSLSEADDRLRDFLQAHEPQVWRSTRDVRVGVLVGDVKFPGEVSWTTVEFGSRRTRLSVSPTGWRNWEGVFEEFDRTDPKFWPRDR